MIIYFLKINHFCTARVSTLLNSEDCAGRESRHALVIVTWFVKMTSMKKRFGTKMKSLFFLSLFDVFQKRIHKEHDNLTHTFMKAMILILMEKQVAKHALRQEMHTN